MSVKKLLNDKKRIDKLTKLIFDTIDKDGSGLIELNEFEIIMNSISKDMGMTKPPLSEIRTVFNTLDKDGSGLISEKNLRFLVISILEGFA